MIFAEMDYALHYSEIHNELVDHLRLRFPDLQCGLQGDSWIWVIEDSEKVAIDTFTSMKHQIKANASSHLVDTVISMLSLRYTLRIVDPPEWESHEASC